MPSIKCSRFHSQETENSIDGNDSPGGGAELCPPDFVFLVMTRRKGEGSREGRDLMGQVGGKGTKAEAR